MAAALRSTLGRKQLLKRKRFGKEQGLRDWTLLVELLLEWEAFLCTRRMKRSHVVRLKEKHRFIMYIMRNVAKRSKGMGLKIMKFHSILHLMDDILLYGVPFEFDTGAQESHHKTSKVAARMTQRKEATFDHQVGTRMTEFMAIDMGILEIDQRSAVVWEYFSRGMAPDSEGNDSIDEAFLQELDALNVSTDATSTASSGNPHGSGTSGDESDESILIRTAGTRIRIFEDSDEEGAPAFEVLGKSKHRKKTAWSTQLLEWLSELQNLVQEYLPTKELSVLTEHRRGHIIFRGHPNHRGDGPWKDWALFDWGPGYGILPGHIWCFVELAGLPSGRSALEFGGVRVENGVFAVIEAATYDDIEGNDLQSDLFTPITVGVGGMDGEGNVTSREFYLADVSSITGPCVVVPDIGGPKNAYFQVKSRRDWAKEFVHWLDTPHDDMIMSDQEDDLVAEHQKKRAKKV